MKKKHLFTLLISIAFFALLMLFIIPSLLKLSDIAKGEIIQIYVYDWSSELINCWPKQFQHHRLSFESHFQQNSFEGKLIDDKKSLYHTHQYSLYPIFLNRLKRSPYYTKDPEKATHFFIPYDVGMCSSTRLEDGALTATNCPQMPKILQLLQQSKYFQRHNGYDHILIHSINHMMLHFLNKPCQSLYSHCINCLKFSIDYYTSSVYPVLKHLSHLTRNWVSVPFPSNFHANEIPKHSSNYSSRPWKRIKESPSTFFPKSYLEERIYPFCFIGNVEVTAKKQKTLRIKLFQFCEKYPKNCYSLQLLSHSSNAEYLSPTALHSMNLQIQNQNSTHHFVNAYEQCKFCLIPGGDFPTRKAFFDAILSGCIPIAFQLETAHLQWPFHWLSKNHPYRSVVLYSRELFMRNSHEENYKQFMEMNGNLSLIRDKLIAISEVGSRLQYNHLPTLTKGNGKITYKPQEKDAFEVIMEFLLTTITFD